MSDREYTGRMRWATVRLIWLRELRDQLRDRRTIIMIAVLPLVLYPLLGVGVIQFALSFVEQPNVVGIVGTQHLPPEIGPIATTTWIGMLAPGKAFPGASLDSVLGALALTSGPFRLDYPPLVVDGHFAQVYFDRPSDARLLLVERYSRQGGRAAQEARQADLLLIIDPQFLSKLESGARARLELVYREGDDRSRLTSHRLYGVLIRWRQHLRAVRLVRHGLPIDFDTPFDLLDPEKAKSTEKVATESLLEVLVRIFPFILVMWSLAGALYPAIDLCAGEKERGTMETLLISPASREEIVWGKFLTIWVFSALTALLNLMSMGITTWQLSGQLAHAILPTAALLWSVVLVLPLSAFFSALCLALGAYARSSKEGQYYLMPLFLLTMPFIFITLAPGVELNQFYSLVPVTGVALLMQELLTASLDQVRWLYFVPVFAAVTLYSWLALRWAIEQFKREEVLFREAERLDIGLWLKRLLREKEEWPSAGQAAFCFALIVGFRWFSLGLGGQLTPVARTVVSSLAFVAVPPLFMAILLTTRPRQALALRLAPLLPLVSALFIAGAVFLPLAELERLMLYLAPALQEALSDRRQLMEWSKNVLGTTGWHSVLLVGLLPAVCEEIAFRGFILSGLRRRYRPWTAILLSALLFALYFMNVFQLLPAFLLGVVLAILAVRSNSVLPGILYHILHNVLIVGAMQLPDLAAYGEMIFPPELAARIGLSLGCTLVVVGILFLLSGGLRPPPSDAEPQLRQPVEVVRSPQ